MQLELPRDNEILLRREFAASKAHVYLAITTPELVRRWWAPRSRGEMTHCTIDLRVGGRWRYEMRTTTGFVVGFSGEYLEIDGPDRVVCTEVFDLAPDFPSMVTSTLEERGGRTTLCRCPACGDSRRGRSDRKCHAYPNDLRLAEGAGYCAQRGDAPPAGVVPMRHRVPQGTQIVERGGDVARERARRDVLAERGEVPRVDRTSRAPPGVVVPIASHVW